MREKDLLARQSQLYLRPERLGEFTLSKKLVRPHLQHLYREGTAVDESQVSRDQKLLRDEYNRLNALITETGRRLT